MSRKTFNFVCEECNASFVRAGKQVRRFCSASCRMKTIRRERKLLTIIEGESVMTYNLLNYSLYSIESVNSFIMPQILTNMLHI